MLEKITDVMIEKNNLETKKKLPCMLDSCDYKPEPKPVKQEVKEVFHAPSASFAKTPNDVPEQLVVLSWE